MFTIAYFLLHCLSYLTKAVKFNWINREDDTLTKKICIDLEYRLRPRITKFLLSQYDSDYLIDFSQFHFDVDLKNQWIWISEKTPQEYIDYIKEDFDIEINGSHLFSVA
nr:hypothetical protein [uncultured Allomuricauda sp.]